MTKIFIAHRVKDYGAWKINYKALGVFKSFVRFSKKVRFSSQENLESQDCWHSSS